MEYLTLLKSSNYRRHILTIIILFFIYLFTVYGCADAIQTAGNGVNFFESLFSGNGLCGYSYESVFYIPCHIIFGIWNLPIIFLSHIGLVKIGYYTIFALWNRILIAAVTFICIRQITSIASKYSSGDFEFGIIFLFSSLIFFMPVINFSGYDVFELSFFLWGISRVLDQEKLTIPTMLILSISCAIKAHLIFPSLLLILLVEKRLLFIIRNVLLLTPVFLAFVLIFSIVDTKVLPPEDAAAINGYNSGFIYRFFMSAFPSGMGTVPILIVLFFAACIFSYWDQVVFTSNSLYKKMLWIFSLYFFSFFCFALAHPQWIVLFAPFLVLLIIENEKSIKTNIIAFVAYECSLFIYQCYNFNYVYLVDTSFGQMFLKKVPHSHVFNFDVQSFSKVIDSLGWETYIHIFYALAFVSAIFILFINYPKKSSWDFKGVATINDKKKYISFQIFLLIAYWIVDALITFVI